MRPKGNDRFATTRGMSDVQVEERQRESRRTTRESRECDCRWCSTGPRRAPRLLVKRFNYAPIPTVS